MHRNAFAAALLLFFCADCNVPARAELLGEAGAQSGQAEAEPALRIRWEAKNRFRLFRNERDFERQLAANRGDGVLAAEQRLARDSDGRGWAADLIGELCVDPGGQVEETCVRDGRREDYLAPSDHRVSLMLDDPPADAACTWALEDGEGARRQITIPCDEAVATLVRFGRPTAVKVEAILPDESTRRGQAEILVRDLLIVGMGDSIASGDGNPDRPVALSNDGFCFRRFLAASSTDYFRPGRAGFSGDKTCDTGTAKWDGDWNRYGAGWISAACHRSLYGYQLRAALAIAIEDPHAAVTFVPLGCSGATIADGLLGPQRPREVGCADVACSRKVPPQLAELRRIIAAAGRGIDALLLTIGANDVFFSGLVGNLMIHGTERALFARAGLLATTADAQAALERELPAGFARLRAALKPLVGGDLWRVIFVSYAHPALLGGETCPGGRDGFDIHPGFAIDTGRLEEASRFVASRFLPKLRKLALCDAGTCRDATDRMTFVDAHQRAFADHGFCARSPDDPEFDRACFSATGHSFQESLVAGVTDPLTCHRGAGEFRAYASRARWIRTANDSYFAAMTYPEGLPAALQPSDIHDATWGALSAVYGGAWHPTAEGHAAIADAALPALREVLGLPPPTQ